MKKYAARLRNVANTGDENFAEIVKHGFWALVALVIATGLQFAFDLSMARSFGADGAGLFYLCLSVLMALALVGRAGLERAVIRFIPPFLSKGLPNEARGVYTASTMLTLWITIPLALLLFVLAPVLAEGVFNEPKITPYLRIFAFAAPPFALMYVYGGVLRALKRTWPSIVVERIAIYTLGIAAVLVLGRFFGLNGAVIGFAAASFVAAGLGAWLIHRRLPTTKKAVPFNKKRLMLTAGPLLFVIFGTQMTGQASVLILGAVSDSTSVGIFNIALKVSMLMTLVLTAINAIAGTKIAELYFGGKREQLEILLSKISALGAVCAMPIFVFIALFPNFLLGLFGSEFTPGTTALVVLAVGQLLNVSLGSSMFTLAMTGHERVLAATVVLALVFNVGLGLALIPALGVAGAGITTTATLAATNIALVILVKHRLGVWQLPFKVMSGWFRHLRT